MNYSKLKMLITFAIIFLTSCNFTSDQENTRQHKSNEGSQDELNASLGDPPGSYVVEREKNEYIIPFEFYGMNLMVDAKMNNMDIKMLIDNGVMWDELLFYGGSIVDSLEIKQEGDILVIGAGEGNGAQSKTASNLSIAFGDVLFNEQNAVITTKESGFSDYFPGIAGQVCGAFFKHFIVEINFDKNVVILHNKETYTYAGNGNPIKMTRNPEGSYSIPIRLKMLGKESIDLDIFVDLGGIDPVALPINEKLGFERPSKTEKIYLGSGASGEVYGYKSNIEHLNIAGYDMANVPTIIEESENEGNYINMTVGLPLLMKFNIVFDYFNEVLYLEPNDHFNQAFKKQL